jgi:hypothetical protein
MTDLFHCTHRELQPGEIVEPGNWGKKIMEIGPKHQCWAREISLEYIRIHYFSQKPSRLQGTFSCETIETIRAYQSRHVPGGFIYRVELVDASLPTHKGDFNAVQPLPRVNADMVQIALWYWEYKFKTSVEGWSGVECSEIVSSSPLKVLEVVSNS